MAHISKTTNINDCKKQIKNDKTQKNDKLFLHYFNKIYAIQREIYIKGSSMAYVFFY